MSVYARLKGLYRRRFDPDQEHAAILARWFRAGKILDVGCGRGAFARLAPDRIVGLDGNSDNLRAARAAGARTLVGSVVRLPVADNAVAGVYCSHVIEHLLPEDAHRLLAELSRVLAPDGVLVLRSPMPHPRFYDEISHIRPYPPNVVLEVYWSFPETSHTLVPQPAPFEFVSLQWRYPPLAYPRLEPAFNPTRLWFAAVLKVIGLGLQAIGVHGFKPDGYTLVLRKRSDERR